MAIHWLALVYFIGTLTLSCLLPTPTTTLRGPFLSILVVAILSIPLLGAHAQSVNKTVDDSQVYETYQPDGIEYHPAWLKDNRFRERLGGTYHYTLKADTNLIYFFQGNSIYYYANKNKNNHAPTIVYIDGDEGETALSDSPSIQYQQLIWGRTNLGPGDHQIVISNGGQDGQIVGLDYLVIESDHGFIPSYAGPTASSIPPETIIVDDTDLEHIAYYGWEKQVYESKDRAFFYNNSLHRTDQPGSFATFKFNGTAVWYISDRDPGHGLVNITLDGKLDSMVNVSSGTIPSLAQRIIWNATNLPYGEHTVVLTHQDRAGVYTTLDYFRYLPGEPPRRSNLPANAIIGGVLGGVVLIILCATGYMFFWRRRVNEFTHSLNLDTHGPPMLNLANVCSQSDTSQPAWGYVATPFVPHRTLDTSIGHSNAPKPRKGQVAQNLGSSSVLHIVAMPSSPIVSTEDSVSSIRPRDESVFRDGESALNPPPYDDSRCRHHLSVGSGSWL